MKFIKAVKLFLLAGVLSLSAISAQAVSISASGLDDLFVNKYSFTLTETSSFEAKASGIDFGGFLLLDASKNVLGAFGITDDSDTPVLTGILSSGKYKVIFAGSASGFGAYSFITTPVPEANELAMMITGLGMLGFIAVRRRNNI